MTDKKYYDYQAKATCAHFWCASLKEKLIAAQVYWNVRFAPSLPGREVLSSAFAPEVTFFCGVTTSEVAKLRKP